MKRAIALGGPPLAPAPEKRRKAPQRGERRKPREVVARPDPRWYDFTAPTPQDLSRAALIAELRPLCRPRTAADGPASFPEYGILPHGRPLHRDGTTTCARCHRLVEYAHLTNGICSTCPQPSPAEVPPSAIEKMKVELNRLRNERDAERKRTEASNAVDSIRKRMLDKITRNGR